MTQKPQQRRGLGRGLGSLIPTAPRPEEATTPSETESATSAASVSDAPAPGAADWSGAPGAKADDHGADEPAPPTGPTASPSGSEDQAGLQPVEGVYFAELPVTSIVPNPRQPRQVFDEDAMAELVHSVREIGLLQPVVVRPVGEGRFELVMGERRWRATQEAGLEVIPAIVRETGDDALLRDALLENLHRSELNPLEEAAAYQQLLDDFGCTHEELATRIGRSRPQISNTLRLLKLSPAVQRRVAAGVLSAGHARTLLGVEHPEVQDRLAARVVAEGISVRGLEEIVAVGDLGTGPSATAARRSRPTAPALTDLAARLSDRLETRVKVDLGKRKGRITVEFASLPDLERIIGLIDPGHAVRERQGD
ncbi:ParB/RepB/Spo0J family partition protein [soil metagenome]